MSVEQGWPGLAQYTPAVPADWTPLPRTVQDALDQLGGRAPGLSTESSFVYRPGGVSAPGVYVTAAQLLAAVDAEDTAQNKVISVDASLVGGTAVINNGPWPDNITWQSGQASVLAVLELDEGTTFAGLTYRFRNIAVAPHNTAIIWTIGAGTSANLVLDQGAELAPSGAGHVFADVAGTLAVSAFESIIGDGTAGHELFEVEATGLLNVFLFDASAFNANASKQGAAPGGAMNLGFDGASQSTVSATQVPVPVTLNFDPQPTFVFRPAAPGIPGANVFTTWAALMASTTLSPGTKTIVIDDTFAPAHMPAGGPYDLDNVTLSGAAAGSETLIIDIGATFTSTSLRLKNGCILQNNNTASPWTTTAFFEFYLEDPNSNAHSTTAAALLAVTAPGSGGSVFVGTACIFGNGVNPVITTAAGQISIVFQQGIGSVVAAHALAGLGTTTIAYSNVKTPSFTQDVTTLTRAYNGTTNLVQAAGNGGTGTHTVTETTAGLAQLLSGKVKVEGACAGATAAADAITATLVRDVAGANVTIATQTITTTATQLNYNCAFSFIDTLPDLLAHTYSIRLTGAQNNAVAANQAIVNAYELP